MFFPQLLGEHVVVLAAKVREFQHKTLGAGENRSEIFIEVWLAPLPSGLHMHAGDSCRPYRAAGQIQRFTHHRKHNMSMRQRGTERERETEMFGRGWTESAHGGRFEPWRYRFVFSFYFIFLLFLTDTFPVYFLSFRSKSVCVILNLTATCIHIKLHFAL